MNTNRELDYRLYLQREEEFIRTDVRKEFSRYEVIIRGDVEQVKKNYEEVRPDFFAGKGVLSKNPLRNSIYHLVVSIGVIARMCVEAGLPHSEAYTISDIYIQRADEAKTVDEVLDLIGDFQVDFALRMRTLQKKAGAYSLYVRHAIDYIYDHLHQPLRMEDLARAEGLSPGYFSKLFAREVGTTVKVYILMVKLNTAGNMLRNSEHSISDISLSLGFSSQSAFTTAFKKHTGYTPAEYRERQAYIKIV
ncbi:MAG: helix-turn-helix transcriptional regulator [Eubacterium sp.]|nr:helix-turn-helix transcriptional regulator [Eubacterium sp.]